MNTSVRQTLPASTALTAIPSLLILTLVSLRRAFEALMTFFSSLVFAVALSIAVYSFFSPSTPQQKRRKLRHLLILSLLQSLECYQAIPEVFLWFAYCSCSPSQPSQPNLTCTNWKEKSL